MTDKWNDIETVQIPVSMLKRLLAVGQYATDQTGVDCRDLLAEAAAQYALGDETHAEVARVVEEIEKSPQVGFQKDGTGFTVYLPATGNNPGLKQSSSQKSVSDVFAWYVAPFQLYLAIVTSLREQGFAVYNGRVQIKDWAELQRLKSLYDHVEVDTYSLRHLHAGGLEISVLNVWNNEEKKNKTRGIRREK